MKLILLMKKNLVLLMFQIIIHLYYANDNW